MLYLFNVSKPLMEWNFQGQGRIYGRFCELSERKKDI